MQSMELRGWEEEDINNLSPIDTSVGDKIKYIVSNYESIVHFNSSSQLLVK